MALPRGQGALHLALDVALPAVGLRLGDQPVADEEQHRRGEQHRRALEHLAGRARCLEQAHQRVRRQRARHGARHRAVEDRGAHRREPGLAHVREQRADDQHDFEPLAQDDERGLERDRQGAGRSRRERGARRVEIGPDRRHDGRSFAFVTRRAHQAAQLGEASLGARRQPRIAQRQFLLQRIEQEVGVGHEIDRARIAVAVGRQCLIEQATRIDELVLFAGLGACRRRPANCASIVCASGPVSAATSAAGRRGADRGGDAVDALRQ